MPFHDFDVFYRATQALLNGQDPYALDGVFYPLPTFFLFIPFAFLPFNFAIGIWTAIEIISLVALIRKRTPWIVLSMPVILSFVMGQTVLILFPFFYLLRRKKYEGFSLAMLLLKPQLILALAPWLLWHWLRDPAKRVEVTRFLTITIVLAISAFVVQPDWVIRMWAVSGTRLRAPISPSVWGVFSFLPLEAWISVASLITLALVVWAWRKNEFDWVATIGMLVNPVVISYDLVFLLPILRSRSQMILFTVVSLIAFGLSALWLTEAPVVLTSLTIAFSIWQNQKMLDDRSLPQTARHGDRFS